MMFTIQVEYADARKMRQRNTRIYRLAHWPIWIWVFFLSAGPLTFNLFAHGGHRSNLIWLLLVMTGTGIAGLFGQLPGVEPKPYILRFTEDKPNPLYRRICYTFAWNAVITFTLLNLTGLIAAAATGRWFMKQIYFHAYFPLCAIILLLGAMGLLPRVGRSTKGEGTERRYFYGSVWASAIAHCALLPIWKLFPESRATTELKLGVFIACLILAGVAAAAGLLPRTRPIIPGEFIVD